MSPQSLAVDESGNVFVLDRREPFVKVFEAEGRFIGRAALPRHTDLINPKTRILKKGKLYTVEPGEEGYEIVKQYSATWLIE